MEYRRKNIDASELELRTCGEMEYFVFPKLEKTGIVKHLFSTRKGGVSQKEWSSLNLSFTRGDEEQHVRENFNRVATVMGCSCADMISTDQTHTCNVKRVGKAEKGHGITREKTFFDTDGLVTKDEGVVLAAFFADCVPLYFVDPVKKAIGLSHSGWKGTLLGIGEKTVQKMQEEFGSEPKDLIAAIGPSICKNCYEVSEEVKIAFEERFWQRYQTDKVSFLLGVEDIEDEKKKALFYQKENGKYQLDLWLANSLVLQKAGIEPQNISVTDVCTCCNKELLFSHRGSQGKRGNLGAFLGLN